SYARDTGYGRRTRSTDAGTSYATHQHRPFEIDASWYERKRCGAKCACVAERELSDGAEFLAESQEWCDLQHRRPIPAVQSHFISGPDERPGECSTGTGAADTWKPGSRETNYSSCRSQS